jgi:ribosome modulation factor
LKRQLHDRAEKRVLRGGAAVGAARPRERCAEQHLAAGRYSVDLAAALGNRAHCRYAPPAKLRKPQLHAV